MSPTSVALPRIGVESPLALHRDALLLALSTGGQHEGILAAHAAEDAAPLDAVICDVLDPHLTLQLAHFASNGVPTVVWGGFIFADDVRTLLAQGACGYVSMIARTSELLAAVNQALEGGQWVPELPEQAANGLSPAQQRAMRAYLVTHATSTRAEVAASLGLSDKTLKNHIAAARQALDLPAPTRPALRRALEARGWL